jgi:hypothetical protein
LPPIEVFFDRTVGTSIPEAMRLLGLKNVYHHHIHPAAVGMKPLVGQRGLFKHDIQDDVFLEFVGKRGWIVIGQDYSYHLYDQILDAIKAHKIGVFYVWGANATKWETMRVITRTYPRMLEIAESVERPFIFKISKSGRFRRVNFSM